MSLIEEPKPNDIGLEKKDPNSTNRSIFFDETLYSRQFIENVEDQYNGEEVKKGDGLDIYIDSFRHLPDNISLSMIRC